MGQRTRLQWPERRSEVPMMVLWFTMMYIMCASVGVESRCMSQRTGFKCIVSSQDDSSDLKFKIMNMDPASDIQVNALKFVSGCRNSSEPSRFRETPTSRDASRSREVSGSVISRSRERSDSRGSSSLDSPGSRASRAEDSVLLISRGGSKMITLDEPSKNQCSVFMTKSCQTSSGQEVDCKRVMAIL